jgi:hypothetical protein
LTFLVFKAKVNAEASFEMSADGDPSTLNMTLKVLRCVQEDVEKMGAETGDMIELIIDENQDPINNKTPAIEFPGYTKA